ncbi:hypothetical protein HPB52_012015 [Rhipicephalus sanguineus]|uniref:CCHC-type domain-containing protein n=1 Tax=Rhipicephalus sanguineus TaxID=34632 RepID=A0A9D4QGI2_RHISA|nr:hypothetical protein HPB52_012015 [Rhipicephalus sanguineus]
MDREKFISLGRELGLKKAELREWVEKECALARDERAREREEAKESAERQRQLQEQELKILELKLKLQESAGRQSSEAGEPGGSATSTARAPEVCSPHKLIPPFNETRDDLDAYLQRFERVATCQGWPREKWALSLSLSMTGEAMTVIGRLDLKAALDYDQLRAALLQRFRYTAEGYREKFRKAKSEDNESGLQHASRLAGYFDHWLELSKSDKTFNALRDLIIAEQFTESCLPALRVFLKERNCRTLQEIAQTSDNFMDAQSLLNLGKERACRETGPPTSPRMELARKTPRTDDRCFLCDKKGHRAAECWSRTKACSQVHGHNSDKYSAGKGDRCEASCMVSGERNEEKAAGNAEYVILRDGEKVPVVNTAVSRSVVLENIENVPIVKGFMDKRPVTVLRDTGCDMVVVGQALVPKERLTGAYRPVLFLDRTVRNLPEAVVFLDTPLFKGEVRAHCLRDSLYDVVLGNITGAVSFDNPRVMKTRTINPNSSADIEEKTPKNPYKSPDWTHYRGAPTPQDESWLSLDTTPRVPQRRRPRQHSYFEERNTGRLNQSPPGYLTLRSDGTDSLSAQMDQSPSSPQPPLQPPRSQSHFQRHKTETYKRRDNNTH